MRMRTAAIIATVLIEVVVLLFLVLLRVQVPV